MTDAEWKALWKEEETQAHIHGWDLSHIRGRFEEEHDLPWDYRGLVREYLREDMDLLDCDTGGGEFLLSLGHPAERTAATEGWPPNVKLCREVLPPLGIDFRECADPSAVPFPDESFDLILNRHGSFDPAELVRLFLHHLLGQVGNIVKMIVKGVPVYAAPLHNVLDGDFVHRLLTQKLYKRIHNRTACPFHRKASFSWSFGKSRRQLCPRTDITFLGHKNIILAPSEKCNQKTTPFSDAVFKERSYVL